MHRLLKRIWALSFTTITSFLLHSAPASSQGLVINEVMSSNQTGLIDEDGERQDWIEIYNPSDQAVNLGGFGLSDNRNNLLKWTFPDVTILPNDYLTVFASGKNRTYIANHNEGVIMRE